MPKYQIILSSEEILPDDEFRSLCEGFIGGSNHFANMKMKLVYARNLEGIRKELWEEKEKMQDSMYDDESCTTPSNNRVITETFNKINQLFKLD